MDDRVVGSGPRFTQHKCVVVWIVVLATALCFLGNPPLAAADADVEGESELRSSVNDRNDAAWDELTWEPQSWLRVFAEIELQWLEESQDFEDPTERSHNLENFTKIDLGFETQLSEAFDGFLLLTYDTDEERVEIDELALTWQHDELEIVLGKQTLPFGEIYTYFPTDPFLENLEVKETAVTLYYDARVDVELSASIFDGDVHREGTSRSVDGLVGVKFWPSTSIRLGAALISDIAESDGQFLADEGNSYRTRVPGLTANALIMGDHFELALEATSALDSFEKLDADIDRPQAVNAELALFLNDRARLAFRYERAWELESLPRSRFGIGAFYRVHPRVDIGLQWLEGRFDADSSDADEDSEEADDESPRKNRFLGASVVVRF